MDNARFNKFHKLLAERYPDFKIAFKTESSLTKTINLIVCIFNKNFMTNFITTVGSTVYFPSPAHIDESEYRSIATLAHEYVHVVDSKRASVLIFGLLYLMPLPLFFILMALGFLWWPLFLISLVFLLPLPAPYRTWAEMRGYTMTLFVMNEIYKERGMTQENRKVQLYEVSSRINENFTGFNYYLMWPFGKQAELEEKSDKIISGDILKEDAMYKEVQIAFTESRK